MSTNVYWWWKVNILSVIIWGCLHFAINTWFANANIVLKYYQTIGDFCLSKTLVKLICWWRVSSVSKWDCEAIHEKYIVKCKNDSSNSLLIYDAYKPKYLRISFSVYLKYIFDIQCYCSKNIL